MLMLIAIVVIVVVAGSVGVSYLRETRPDYVPITMERLREGRRNGG